MILELKDIEPFLPQIEDLLRKRLEEDVFLTCPKGSGRDKDLKRPALKTRLPMPKGVHVVSNYYI